MKHAVDWVYTLLWLRLHAPEKYKVFFSIGMLYTDAWDKPQRVKLPRNLASLARRTIFKGCWDGLRPDGTTNRAFETYARPFLATAAATLPATSHGRFSRSTAGLSRSSMRS